MEDQARSTPNPDLGKALKEILDLLQWQSQDVSIIKTASFWHMQWSYEHLWHRTRRVGPDLWPIFRALPVVNQRRVLFAPGFHRMLWDDEQADELQYQAMRVYIGVESALSENRGETDVEGWSALGDCYLLPNGSLTAFAPLIHRKPILFTLSKQLSNFPDTSGVMKSYEEHTHGQLLHIIQEALDFILGTSTVAMTIIDTCVQSITVLRSDTFPALALSVSNRSMIGNIGLLNINNEATWNPAKLCNQLIHEAVHSLLYKIELRQSFYTSEGAGTRLTVRSPWSGRVLQLHSFIHACFVWFALKNFWESRLSLLKDSPRLHAKACKGFAEDDVWRLMDGPTIDAIAPELRQAIATMFSTSRQRLLQ